ncbi:MAG TPA: serine/threonine-protein kinase, partial [Pyrinomonadaceae bacterium]|nr:serine/threonine-protein kinase [Pyrinomonadaceae bacterium]
MLEKGRKIGDYVLAEKVGHGGFGDVWRAEKHTALSVSSVALKFFRPKETEQVDIAEVKRELEVWQKVSGLPNIISAIEADFVEDYIYIVSEFAEGGSMQKWLAANGGKAESVEQAVSITLEILNGLDHLHRTGFIHRDIKPANILIRKGTFCLADFGVTREVKTHSITMHTAGTYQYMPPEAFSKKPIVTPATDIWAVGVILQELLTGRLPFPPDEIPSLMYSILNDEPEEMPPDIPKPLHEIVHRALQKQREDRYSTAQEMMTALNEAQTEIFQAEEPQVEEKPAEEIKEKIKAEEPKPEIPIV